jgi:hypothetical protein
MDRLNKHSVREHKNIRLDGEIGPNKAVTDPLGINSLTGGLVGALLPGVPGVTTGLSGPAGTSQAPSHGHSHSQGHGLNNPLVSGILGGLGLGALGNLAGGIGGRRKADWGQDGARGLNDGSFAAGERSTPPFHTSTYGRGGEPGPTQQYLYAPASSSPSDPGIQNFSAGPVNQSPYAPSMPQDPQSYQNYRQGSRRR